MSLEGTKLKGRYVIQKELGRGGLGIVYLAHDIHLKSRPVVIKTMIRGPGDLTDPWFIEKFEKEIAALIKVRHPGIIGVLDAGQMQDGNPFFVMQFVEGLNLRGVLSDGGLDLERAAHIIHQVSFALSAAHDQGITHRDLKPENIMLQVFPSGEEVAFLIDFGIARIRDLQAEQLNQKTRVVGTIPYMAPEQLRGEPILKSDIWSLGVVAYETVTGRLPFPTNNVLELADMQQEGVRILPKALRPGLSTTAQDVILKALSPDPARRFDRAHLMGDAFLQAILNTEVGPQPHPNAPQPPAASDAPEIGHILFMDVVGYSKLAMNEQRSLMQRLVDVVSETSEFRRARSDQQLIRLPTGDGMALVFFKNPLAAVQCALETAAALKRHPDVSLRMGLHSGPVLRVLDINQNPNVAGSGINLAQRVMDSGDAGHILVSHSMADNLVQLGHWQEYLQDLGQHEVKHGAVVHFFNLYKGDLGCPNWPSRLKKHQKSAAHPTLKELLRQCRELFGSFDEFRSPDSLRAFLRLGELAIYERCVSRSAGLDFDLLIDCLKRSGREYPGQALVELLTLLALNYSHDYRWQQCEDVRNNLKGLLTRN